MDNAIATQATNEPQAGNDPQGGQVQQQVQQPTVDWKSLTGFDSPDAIKEVATRASTLEVELNELRTKSAVSPFANPIIEEMNKLVASGRDIASLPKFLTLQSQDFEKMSSEEAIKWQQKMAMPRWSDADVNDWFDAEYPKFSTEDDEDAIRKNRARDLRLDTIAEAARKELAQMKVDAGKPDETKAQQQAVFQQRQQQLSGVAETLINGITEIPVEYEHKGENGDGWKYELKYKPNITPELRKMVINTVVADHAGRGTSLDEAGLQKIKGDISQLIEMMSMKDMVKAIIMDTRSSMLENITRQNSNTNPTPRGAVPVKSQQPRQQQPEKRGSYF